MAIYSITDSGLAPLAGESLFLGIGQRYYIGYSSDPDMAIITGFRPSKDYGRVVIYRTYPYEKDAFAPEPIFRDLARKGIATFLQRRGNPETWKPYGGMPQWAREELAALSSVVAGEAGELVDVNDYRRVKVTLHAPSVSDSWTDFEQRFSGFSVSGARDDGRWLEVYTTSAGARELERLTKGTEYKIFGTDPA